MTQKDNGGPAFPGLLRGEFGTPIRAHEGMTLRAYAAINLQQPDSGTDWLDAMILSVKRDWFAGQALTGMLAGSDPDRVVPAVRAKAAYIVADAMLAERDK